MKLETWIRRNGLSQRDAAQKFKISQGNLSKLLNKQHRPGWQLMRRIYKITNDRVKPNDFADWL